MTGRKATVERQQPAAVVIGLDTMQGIQTARLLAERGVIVHGLAGNIRHGNVRTRACASVVATPGGGQAIIDALLELGPSLGERAVLFPCQDSAVTTISAHRDQLSPWYHVALPSHDLVTTLMDKVAFHGYAVEHELPVPTTHILRTRDDAVAAARALDFPCALKPAYRSGLWSENTTIKAFKIESSDELIERYDQVQSWSELLLVQQWIPGGEDKLFSVNAYFDAHGKPLATFVARKIRQWPPTTGQSSLGIECRNDDVLATALRLFTEANYHGLAYLEMKQDVDTGMHYIVEPNIGRPTGRSSIAEAGGVELLYTAYCDIVGLPLPEQREQSYGDVKWIHLRRDFQSALHAWRNGGLSLREWRRSVKGPKAYAMWSLRDPVPFLADLVQTAQALASKKERSRRLPVSSATTDSTENASVQDLSLIHI